MTNIAAKRRLRRIAFRIFRLTQTTRRHWTTELASEPHRLRCDAMRSEEEEESRISTCIAGLASGWPACDGRRDSDAGKKGFGLVENDQTVARNCCRKKKYIFLKKGINNQRTNNNKKK